MESLARASNAGSPSRKPLGFLLRDAVQLMQRADDRSLPRCRCQPRCRRIASRSRTLRTRTDVARSSRDNRLHPKTALADRVDEPAGGEPRQSLAQASRQRRNERPSPRCQDARRASREQYRLFSDPWSRARQACQCLRSRKNQLVQVERSLEHILLFHRFYHQARS